MRFSFPVDAAVLTVSVAAEIAGMHPQTLRQYDRLGLVQPSRTRGGGRRYSLEDVERLREVQRLSQEEGVNLAGISRIMELERQQKALVAENAKLRRQNEELRLRFDDDTRVFAASAAGDVMVVPRGQRVRVKRQAGALVLWRPPRSLF